MLKTCADCVYWERINKAATPPKEPVEAPSDALPPPTDRPANPDRGYCRIYPPGPGTESNLARWPITTVLDWCGSGMDEQEYQLSRNQADGPM